MADCPRPSPRPPAHSCPNRNAIDADPDLAPRTETLPPFLEAHEVRKKRGLTPAQFAGKLGVPVAAIECWEREETPADPVLQALLRILDRIPEPALRALDGAAPQDGKSSKMI